MVLNRGHHDQPDRSSSMPVSVKLATSPVTWGVDFADRPTNPPWELVLDEIQQSGVHALELGPVGYLPEDPLVLLPALESRGLHAVGSFIFDDLHDPDRTSEVLATATRACRVIAAASGEVLVIIDRPGPERVATAGRSAVAARLSPERWAAMLDLTASVAAVARDFGLRPVFHPHVGGYVEFEDEIERLVADTDLDLCLDTGHCAYARIDPVAAIEAFASRLAYVHLKDVTGDVLTRIDREGLDFWSAIELGVFCPLGEGVVDIGAVLDALDVQGYTGYATIEQDRVPGSGDPLGDLKRSLDVIERAQERSR
jgi:inosose dehydratase